METFIRFEPGHEEQVGCSMEEGVTYRLRSFVGCPHIQSDAFHYAEAAPDAVDLDVPMAVGFIRKSLIAQVQAQKTSKARDLPVYDDEERAAIDTAVNAALRDGGDNQLLTDPGGLRRSLEIAYGLRRLEAGEKPMITEDLAAPVLQLCAEKRKAKANEAAAVRREADLDATPCRVTSILLDGVFLRFEALLRAGVSAPHESLVKTTSGEPYVFVPMPFGRWKRWLASDEILGSDDVIVIPFAAVKRVRNAQRAEFALVAVGHAPQPEVTPVEPLTMLGRENASLCKAIKALHERAKKIPQGGAGEYAHAIQPKYWISDALSVGFDIVGDTAKSIGLPRASRAQVQRGELRGRSIDELERALVAQFCFGRVQQLGWPETIDMATARDLVGLTEAMKELGYVRTLVDKMSSLPLVGPVKFTQVSAPWQS